MYLSMTAPTTIHLFTFTFHEKYSLIINLTAYLMKYIYVENNHNQFIFSCKFYAKKKCYNKNRMAIIKYISFTKI